MVDKARRPWTTKEDETLIKQWDALGSITLISLLLDRSPSSVQTRASRLSLPRRVEENNKHRNRWKKDEEIRLKKFMNEYEDKGKKIPILDLSNKMNRGVDAIAAKLVEIYGHDNVLPRINIPPTPPTDASKKETNSPPSDSVDYSIPEDKSQYKATYKKAQQNNPNSKMRKCLSCIKPFWSEGPQVRICNKCRKNQEDYFAWDW